MVSQTRKSADFIEFLKILDAKYPEGDTIRLILDNHSAHTSKETRRFLATLPENRFAFVFTPTHTSWLNMIESFFSKIKAAMNEAVERQYIKQNPTHKLKIMKDSTTNKLDVYTVDEIRKLQDAVKVTDMELPVALLFDCVIRRGELLVLKFSDIDFDRFVVTIRHSLVESEDSKVPVLKDCKTDKLYRKILVTEHTMKLLKKQRAIYKKNKLRYGKSFADDNFVICQENGKPFLPKSFTRKWTRTLEMHGLRHIKLHGTRHSAISLLLSEGLPLHMVQQRAGHNDPQITLSVYSHVAKDKQNIVAEKLNDLIFSAVNE